MGFPPVIRNTLFGEPLPALTGARDDVERAEEIRDRLVYALERGGLEAVRAETTRCAERLTRAAIDDDGDRKAGVIREAARAVDEFPMKLRLADSARWWITNENILTVRPPYTPADVLVSLALADHHAWQSTTPEASPFVLIESKLVLDARPREQVDLALRRDAAYALEMRWGEVLWRECSRVAGRAYLLLYRTERECERANRALEFHQRREPSKPGLLRAALGGRARWEDEWRSWERERHVRAERVAQLARRSEFLKEFKAAAMGSGRGHALGMARAKQCAPELMGAAAAARSWMHEHEKLPSTRRVLEQDRELER